MIVPPSVAPSISARRRPQALGVLGDLVGRAELASLTAAASLRVAAPPHAASANIAAPATTASGLFRLIVQPFFSVFAP